MISWDLRSAPRCSYRGMPAHTVACFWIVAGLACTAQAGDAQAPADQPYYANGEIHCPDGTSAIFKSAGEPPTDVALKLACEFKGTGEQTAENNAAFDRIEAMKSAPRSPNDLPMEAVWERAPGAPDGEFNDARPYFVSRWGGIVIRGRRNVNLIDRALAARHCGASDNPATDIYFIGEAPANICEGVTEIPPNRIQSITSRARIKGNDTEYTKVGTASGWAVLAFEQNIADVVHSGEGPATGDDAQEWGVSSLGAFYRNEDGKHVFYAPGETVQLTRDFSFVVEPVMDADELAAQATAAIMNAMATDPAIANIGRPKAKTPWQWAFLVVFGVPLALFGGAIYALLRFLRRRRGTHPATGGRSPAQPTILADMGHAASAAAASDAAPVPDGEVRAVNQAEEFFGPSRTSANFRRQGWLYLLFPAGPGLFFFSMLWWGEPTVVTNLFELLYHFVVAKLFPLGLIVLGIAGAILNFRLGSKPEVETLWYRLDHAGLHILHDTASRATPGEIAQQTGEAGALIAWAAMKSVVVVPGASPKVKIVRRSPGAIIDRTATLFAGQKSRDGSLFEDRLPLWFAEMRTGPTAIPTMTGALPTPRDALREIEDE